MIRSREYHHKIFIVITHCAITVYFFTRRTICIDFLNGYLCTSNVIECLNIGRSYQTVHKIWICSSIIRDCSTEIQFITWSWKDFSFIKQYAPERKIISCCRWCYSSSYHKVSVPIWLREKELFGSSNDLVASKIHEICISSNLETIAVQKGSRQIVAKTLDIYEI